MKNLIEAIEIKQKYNIDLAKYLNVAGQDNNMTVVETWINEQQELVLQYIAEHKATGERALLRLLSNARYFETIKKAVGMQIKYSVEVGSDLANQPAILVSGDTVHIIEEGRLDKEMIARNAKNVLHNCGGLLSTWR